MKFSFLLLQKLVPGVKSISETIENLNEHSFEAVLSDKGVIDVSVPANRFSDASSHWGIAREISAITGLKLALPRLQERVVTKRKASIAVDVRTDRCRRYRAGIFDNIRNGSSPKWMKAILQECGIRPVNAVVDIMNYVMLETGQPLHAFDFDKIHGRALIVRKARNGEKIIILDGREVVLDESVLVIADMEKSLAIAGIKGGHDAEVNEKTSRIVVEAANFEGSAIYAASRTLKITSDASLRFAHDISPELVSFGYSRATQLLEEIVGARPMGTAEYYPKKEKPRLIKFDTERYASLIGDEIKLQEYQKILRLLGFTVKPAKGPKSQFFVTPPITRNDISTFEDVAEEVSRIHGLNSLRPKSPRIALAPGSEENIITLKDLMRDILQGMGFDEVYNYSFIADIAQARADHEGEARENGRRISDKLVELENPISHDKEYLRFDLGVNLIKNIKANARFMQDLRMFEIGATFIKEGNGIKENRMVGIVLASKQKENKEIFLEARGVVEELIRRVGLMDYRMTEGGDHSLLIESDSEILGHIKLIEPKYTENIASVLIEINCDKLSSLVEGEREYRPLPKFPGVMRDISLLLGREEKIGDIIQTIQEADTSYIEDVDLIDEYRESLTFRIFFQAPDRTLTDLEVNERMKKIVSVLQTKFRAQIR